MRVTLQSWQPGFASPTLVQHEEHTRLLRQTRKYRLETNHETVIHAPQALNSHHLSSPPSGGPPSRISSLHLASSPGDAPPALALSGPQCQPDEQPARVCGLRGPLHVCLQVGTFTATL